MPQTTSFNIGVGVSCFIGAIGGMYLAYRGYNHIKKVKELQHNSQNKNEFCPICNTKIDSVADTNWTSCINCAQIVCRKAKCSKWIASRGQSEWECLLCHEQRRAHFKASEWLLTQLSRKLQITNVLDLDDISVVDYNNQLDELSEREVNGTISASQKEYIRTFLEDLLSTLLGGSLDNVLVGPIRKNSDYLPICDHECPGLAQANLKRLIQKIIAEAARLPELLNRSGVPPRPEEHLPYFDPKKYNQLLATAVLNKVVDSYHNPRNEILTKDEFLTPNVDINQNTVKPEKDTPKQSEAPQTSAMKVDTQSELQSPAAVSSATSQSAYSDDDSESSEQLLETLIKQQKTKSKLPDLTSDETNDEDYHSIKSVATDSTWEDNWMFKTKKNSNDGTNSIAMLIPSPTEDVKVLIGDRTADEISDLSDNHDSDNDDEYSNSSDSLSDSDEPPADIPNVLVQNKTVIGGKHPLTDFIEKPSDFESLSSQNSFSEAKNDLLISEDSDFVKVDKPLLDIEYSTLDMKNGNVEKMKEAINPYVERKINLDSEVVAKKDDDSVKIVEKNVVSGVSPAINENTKEIVADSPTPVPRKSSKGDLPAPNNASPKPDHDGIDDDDDDDDDEDEDDDGEGDVNDGDDNVDDDVDDSDFDLISVSSDFSYYKSRNLSKRNDDNKITSPTEKKKFSFVVSNEEICKEILEMAAKQPQDIVMSTIPAIKEETKITISQTVWQPISMTIVDTPSPRAMENTLSTADDEDLVERSLDREEPMDESSKSVGSIMSPIGSDDNYPSLQSINEENPEVTIDVKDQLSEIAEISLLIQSTLNGIMINNQVDEIPQNTIGEHVVVKEYIAEEIEAVEDNSLVIDSNPNETIIEESIIVPDTEVETKLETTDVKQSNIEHQIETTDVKVHQAQVTATQEIDNMSKPICQKSETTELKLETFEITELIEKLKNFEIRPTITEHVTELKAEPSAQIAVILPEQIQNQHSTLYEVKSEEISVPEKKIIVSEEVRKIENIPFVPEESKNIEVVIKQSQIPTIEITPNTPVSISLPEAVQQLEVKLHDLTYSGSLSVEVDANPAIEIQNPAIKLREAEPALGTVSLVKVSEEVRKIEEKLEDLVPSTNLLDPVVEEAEIKPSEPSSVILTKEVRIEQFPQAFPIEITADDHNITKSYEPSISTTDLKETPDNLSKTEIEEPAIDHALEPQIEVTDLKETTTFGGTLNFSKEVLVIEPEVITAIVPEAVRKIEEKLEDGVGTPIVQNSESETQDFFVIVNTSQIIEGKLDDSVTEPLVQTTNTTDIRADEPISHKKPEIREVKQIELDKTEQQEVIVPLNVSTIVEEILENWAIELQTQNTDKKEIVNCNEPVSVVVAEEVRKIEEKALPDETNTAELQKFGEPAPYAETLEFTATLNESQVVEEKLNESLIEPVSVIVAEEIRKIEEKSLPFEDDPQIQTTDLKKLMEATSSDEIAIIATGIARIEDVITEQQDYNVSLNLSQIVEEKLEESVIEPQIQNTDRPEFQIEQPASVIVAEEIIKHEGKSLPVETYHKIRPTDLDKGEEIQEIIVTPNVSQIVETKLVESEVEPQIQNIGVQVIGINELTPLPVQDKPPIQGNDFQNIGEFTPNAELSVSTFEEVHPIESQSITLAIIDNQIVDGKLDDPTSVKVAEEIRKIEENSLPVITGLQKVGEFTPGAQVSLISTEEAGPIASKVQEVRMEMEEIPVNLNESQIVEEKLEESIVEPTLVKVAEEIRKIEENSLPVITGLQKVGEFTPGTQVSLISTEEAGPISSKVQEVKMEMEEIPVNLNESQIVEEKLEESIVEPTSIKVAEEIRKIEENSLPVITGLQKVEEFTPGAQVSLISSVEVGSIESKVQEVKMEMEEIPVNLNESQIIEEKLEESIVEPTLIKVAEEIRKIEENSLPVITGLQKVEEFTPGAQVSIILTEEAGPIASKVQEVRMEMEEIPVNLNESQIIEEKLEESIVEPTSIKVAEEIRKIEENSLPLITGLQTVEAFTPVAEITSLSTPEEVGEEIIVTLHESQIIEEQLEESVVEPQIQNLDASTKVPVSIIVVEEIRKIEEKSLPIENDLQIQTTDIISHISPNRLMINEVETVTPREDAIVNQIDDNREIVNKVEEVVVVQQTKLKEPEDVRPRVEISVISTEPVQTIKSKVEEVKTQIQEIVLPLNASNIVEDKLEESVIEFQIQISDTKEIANDKVLVAEEIPKIEEKLEDGETDSFVLLPEETDVPLLKPQLTKINATLETVPQIELVEFHAIPFLKQPLTTDSAAPIQITITQQTDSKPESPPIDYEIITESEIKTIPNNIGSIMKSSKLVAGVTSKKTPIASLTLKPVTTIVIEEPSTPPNVEALEGAPLTLNLQTIEQKRPESRYSSPLFKPLLPRSPPPPVVKLTMADSPKPTYNNTNPSTSSIIVGTTTTTTNTHVTKPIEEDEVISVELPVPGSIAEREHNKWQNAAPIANNPYSVEVLERRLSQKSYDSLPFKTNESSDPIENGKHGTHEKHLVDVFKAEVPTLKRFGRDYYINEAKKASGERLRRSELLNRQLHNDSTSSDDHVNDSEYQNFLYVRSATEQFVENEQQSNEYPLQKSISSGDTNHLMNENIFAARPIMVEEDDPILEKAQRIEVLSTDDRDFFLLPIEEAQMNIGFSSSEASSLRSPSSLSEDSDTARIYNLRSQEIKKVKEPEPKYIAPKITLKSPIILKPPPTFVPITTPPPPVKLSANTKIMSKSVPMFDTSPELGHTNNKREIPDDITNNVAIEEDIKHVLPSVKNLAKAFTETKDKPAPGPINKPKTPWHSTSNLSKPMDNDTAAQPKPQPVKIAEPFIRPGYSISGRSISKQVKDELRDIGSKTIDSNNNNNTTVNSNTNKVVITPPRTPSPTPVPGALRNTLRFFENLNNKQ